MGRAWLVAVTLTAAASGVAVAAPAAGSIAPADRLSPAHADLSSLPAFVQQGVLRASGGAGGDRFAYSVAVSGSTIVVGAPYHTVDGDANAGAVYVFHEGPRGWTTGTQTAELTASNAGAQDNLGASVAISGNTIVAGAPDSVNGGDHGNCALNPGAAYVYTMPAGGWANATQTAELTTTAFVSYCAVIDFGASVGISGDTVVVGAPYAQATNSSPMGAAYVYAMPTSGWATTSTPTATLTGSDESNDAEYGASVAISGTAIVVGSPTNYSKGGYTGQGRAYLYTMPGGGWVDATQTAELASGDNGGGDDFGYSVAVDGNTVVVGAPYHSAGSSSSTFQSGALYVFVKPSSGWPATPRQTAQLTPSDPHGESGDGVGFAVAISGGTVIGGTWEDAGAAGEGAVYEYTEPASGWPAAVTQTQEITAAAPEHGTFYGWAVAVSGTTAVVGDYTGDPAGPGLPPLGVGMALVYRPVAAPAVSRITPVDGPTTGGTTVRITGTGFTGVTAVHFGADEASKVTVVSATELEVTAPAHAAGTVAVRVAAVGGISALVNADRYTYRK